MRIIISIVNMIEKHNPLDWRTHLTIIGAPTPILRSFLHPSSTLKIPTLESHSFANHMPQSMVSHNGTIAVIDQRNSLWIIGNSFSEPISISEAVRMKAKQIFLGEGQLIFENKRHQWVAVSWGGKFDLPSDKLRKIHIPHNHWNNIFDAYYIEETVQQSSLWHYSTVKKVENTIKLYHINSPMSCIVGFPVGKTIQLPEKIVGMSLGKYHALCWTINGRIFSWGCKNLALGLKRYEKSYYDEAQEIVIQEPILKAHAGINYSIALGISGNLYEWGIKVDGEPLLTPQLLTFTNLRFVDMRGYNNLIAGLTSNNDLYVWGKGVEKIIEKSQNIEEPHLVGKQKGLKIYDFVLEESCIIAVVGKDTGVLSKQEQHYFSEVIRKVSKKWLPHKVKSKHTTRYQHQSHRQFKSADKTPQPARKTQDYIDRLICEKTTKQDFFNLAQNEEILFRQIMNENTISQERFIETRNSTKQHTVGLYPVEKFVKTHRKVQSARLTPQLQFDMENSNKLIRQFEAQRAYSKSNARKLKIPFFHRRDNLNYEQRRYAVMLKKQELEEQKRQVRMNTIQKKSMNMMQRRKIQEEEHEYEQNKKNYNKISSFFKKAYITQLLVAPLDLGREVKIKEFMDNLSFNKISLNMKNILYKNRAVAFLKHLQENEPKKYRLVTRLLIRSIRRWKNNKLRKNRKFVVNRFIMTYLRKSIEMGLGRVWLQSRKLQKVAKWLQVEEKERVLQLKLLWKRSLLLYLKPTPSFENKKPSSCKEELNLKITDRFKTPKLSSYLLSSPIFKLSLRYKAQPLSILKLHHNESLKYFSSTTPSKDLAYRRGVSWAEQQTTQGKLDLAMSLTLHEGDRRISASGWNLMDILLYSQHYDYFYKPKNYQINIPDCMKQSQRWIFQEKKIFNKIIKEILFTQWREFYRKRLEYEYKLAIFIKENYELLTEYRWKYIVEYNKIKDDHNIQIIKRQRELKKLLEGIGAGILLTNDVIPQKHKILEYVHIIKGSPVAPTLQIEFTQQQFKKQFKNYYENVSAKAKSMRKFYN